MFSHEPFLAEAEEPLDLAFALRLVGFVGEPGDTQLLHTPLDFGFISFLSVLLVNAFVVSDGLEHTCVVCVERLREAVFLSYSS